MIVNISSKMFFEACVLLFFFEMIGILAAIPNLPTQRQKFLPPEDLKKHSYKSPEAFKMCLKGGIICVPQNYSKFELPDPTNATKVDVGIDIMDIQNVDDKEYTITINAFFNLRWTDKRLFINTEEFELLLEQAGSEKNDPLPIDVRIMKEVWSPDAEIRNLKEFKTLQVLSKLEGVWINNRNELYYAVASHITFICPMSFDSFPLDEQVCNFQVGSFNYDVTKLIFGDDFIPNSKNSRSVLDYEVTIKELPEEHRYFAAIPGNFSVAGFQLRLKRKVMHYIITCYFPSGMFVVVSWISFLVPPDIIPGRMALLVTVFLVLINIFNTVTSKIPKADGLTAIEIWMIVCVLFVFGALSEYAGVLLQVKIAAAKNCSYNRRKKHPDLNTVEKGVVLVHRNTSSIYKNKSIPIDAHQFKHRKLEEQQKYATLDINFLVIFAIVFLIFNLVYWIGFTGYYKWPN